MAIKQFWPLELATIVALSMAAVVLSAPPPLPGSVLTEDERQARERWPAMTPVEDCEVERLAHLLPEERA